MNREELIELLDAVDQIEKEIEAIDPDAPALSVHYCRETIWVEYNGTLIWHSDNEGSYEQTMNAQPIGRESYETHLRRKINELVADIAKIKL